MPNMFKRQKPKKTAIEKSVANHILHELSKGYSLDFIEKELHGKGFTHEQISLGIKELEKITDSQKTKKHFVSFVCILAIAIIILTAVILLFYLALRSRYGSL